MKIKFIFSHINNNRILRILIIIFLVSISAPLKAQKNQIDSLIDHYKTDYPETGIVVGIYHDGIKKYYSSGTKSKEDFGKLDSLTIFEIGSATKTVASLFLAKSIADGEFGMNDFIDTYLPDSIHLTCRLRNRLKLTDLVSHQSGLPNLSSDIYFDQLLAKDPANPFRFSNYRYLYEILENTDSLNGYRDYIYNNYAYGILGGILEEHYNESVKKLIIDQIIEPLNMRRTSFNLDLENSNRAGLYNQSGEPQNYMELSDIALAGGLKSNAVDLLKYLETHIESKRLKSAIELTQLTYYQDQEKQIGLGWEITPEYFQKDGDTFGNSCILRYAPNQKIGIVVLSNHQNGQLVRDIVNGIFETIRD